MSESRADFDSYDYFSAISVLDDLLWLLDVPLRNLWARGVDGFRNTNYPSNFSTKDAAYFLKHIRPAKGLEMGFYDLEYYLLPTLTEKYPEFKEKVQSLFNKDRASFLVPKEKGAVTINYSREFEFLDLMVSLKDVAYDDLNKFIAERQKDIDKDFYKELIKVIKSNELYVRVAILTDLLYYIFDRDGEDAPLYREMFYKNNKWVFNAKVDKFNEFYNDISARIDFFLETERLNRDEINQVQKKLVEYRRSLYAKYCELVYNFYLDFVD